jgi:hypothetical protein
MTRPNPRLIIGGIRARQSRKALVRFTESIRSQTSSVVRSKGMLSEAPALLTSTSTWSSRARSSSSPAAMEARSVTSMRRAKPRVAAATSSISAWVLPVTTTRAPPSVKRSAIARPMPRPPPVMSASLPSRNMRNV